jgi:hypothetical protein
MSRLSLRPSLLALALVLLAASAALPPAAQAARPWRVLEDSFELPASVLRLPGSATGSLQVLECDGCKAGRYRLADDASFSVAGKTVPYTELAAAFRGGRYRSVYFDLRRDSGEVSRLRIFP